MVWSPCVCGWYADKFIRGKCHMSEKSDEPVVPESLDVPSSPTPTVQPPVRQVWNLELLRDFIGSFAGNLDIHPSAKGHPNDAVRPRTYKLVCLFHDIKQAERVAEVFVERDGNA